jgi:hypothetical protein
VEGCRWTQLRLIGGTVLPERTWDNHEKPTFLSWDLNCGYPRCAGEFYPLYCEIQFLSFHRNVIPVCLIIWQGIYFALIRMWLMTWCLKNTISLNVEVFPVLRHEALTWVTSFTFWLPLLQMKCPLYPLNMPLVHTELNVPWAQVFVMLYKENIYHHCHDGSEGGILMSTYCDIPLHPLLE